MEKSWSVLILLWAFQIFQLISLSQQASFENVQDFKVEARLTDRGPMKKIPGTALFTSVYYNLAKKTPKGGLFTYFFGKNGEGAYWLQVDSDPARADNYKEGNRWYRMDQWVFTEAPDYPGWYELRNHLFPNGTCAVSNSKSEGGFYVVVTEQNDAQFDVGGANRGFALWKPVGVGNEYFQLKNKQFPEGIITKATYSSNPKIFYVQVVTDLTNAGSYQEGGENFDDTLFLISSPPEFVLNAKIEQLVFPPMQPDIYPYKRTFTDKIEYESTSVAGNKTRYKIAKTFGHVNVFSCNVDGIFKDFNSSTLKFDTLERPLSADGFLKGEQFRETEVSMDIEFPSDRSVNFVLHSEAYELVPYLFDAAMVITGTLRDGTILSSDFIRDNLPADWRDSKGFAEEQSSWQINVKGKLKVNFIQHREILTRFDLGPILD